MPTGRHKSPVKLKVLTLLNFIPMPNCINYNCEDVQPHTTNEDCGAIIAGGLPDAVIFDCDHAATDFTNGTQVLAEIAAGRAWKVIGIKIGLPAPTPVDSSYVSPCGNAKLLTYDRTGTLVDVNVNNFNTVDFWDPFFKGRTAGAMIIRECGNPDSKVTLINAEISFRGGKIIPDNDKEEQRYEGTFYWKSKTMPESINEPAGVFV